jgi:hypothetical protein
MRQNNLSTRNRIFRNRVIVSVIGIIILILGLSYISYRNSILVAEKFFKPIITEVEYDYSKLLYINPPHEKEKRICWMVQYQAKYVYGHGIWILVSPTGNIIGTNPVNLKERMENDQSDKQKL